MIPYLTDALISSAAPLLQDSALDAAETSISRSHLLSLITYSLALVWVLLRIIHSRRGK